jgi:hypothetical protein
MQGMHLHILKQQHIVIIYTIYYMIVYTSSVSFYLSLDSAILHYPATNKKKRREYIVYVKRKKKIPERHERMSP